MRDCQRRGSVGGRWGLTPSARMSHAAAALLRAVVPGEAGEIHVGNFSSSRFRLLRVH